MIEKYLIYVKSQDKSQRYKLRRRVRDMAIFKLWRRVCDMAMFQVEPCVKATFVL